MKRCSLRRLSIKPATHSTPADSAGTVVIGRRRARKIWAAIAQHAGLPFTVTVAALDANYCVDRTTNAVVMISQADIHSIAPLAETMVQGVTTFTLTLITAMNSTITVGDASGTLTLIQPMSGPARYADLSAAACSGRNCGTRKMEYIPFGKISAVTRGPPEKRLT